MSSDPEPRDLVVFHESNGAVAEGHTCGEDRFAVMNLLELKARVRGVVAEVSAGLPSRVSRFKR